MAKIEVSSVKVDRFEGDVLRSTETTMRRKSPEEMMARFKAVYTPGELNVIKESQDEFHVIITDLDTPEECRLTTVMHGTAVLIEE